MLLFCVGMYGNDDYKIWLLNGSDCLNINGVSTSLKTINKYTSYIVDKEEVTKRVLQCYTLSSELCYT
jgi:hypothetical protein